MTRWWKRPDERDSYGNRQQLLQQFEHLNVSLILTRINAARANGT